MTQKEIAELLEINQASYAQYERGENAPSIEKLVRLSFIFNCSIDMLLQRNVFYHGKDSMLKILEEWEEDMKNAEEKIKGTDDINIINALRGLQTMVSQLKDIVNTQK